jgi:hypothetical protein
MAALRTRNGTAKTVLYAAVLAFFGAFFVLGSRGALLAIVALLAYYAWKTPHRLQLLAFPLLGALALAPFAAHVAARLAIAFSSGGAGRVPIWQVGLRALEAHWLFGAGLGNFPVAYNEQFIKVYQLIPQGWDRGSHSIFIWSGVELGVVGIVLVLVAWWRQFCSLKFIPGGHRLYHLRVALEGALIAQFCSSFFLDIMYRKYAWLLFSAVAMTAALGMREHERARR